MASGLNKITVIGNLGRDPEIRYTQSGTPVCNIGIGVTERRKEGDEWKDHTEWFNVVCFGKTAENAARFLKKGRQVCADGRIQSRKWQDKEGNQRTSYEIIASQILFLGGGNRDTQDTAASSFGSAPQTSNITTAPAGFIADDDIPF